VQNDSREKRGKDQLERHVGCTGLSSGGRGKGNSNAVPSPYNPLPAQKGNNHKGVD
jgi:hypothetical protein